MSDGSRNGMRMAALLTVFLAGSACDGHGASSAAPLTLAEAFVDAFYSWDAAALRALIQPGADADRVLYYQGWAEAANYRISERQPCRAISPDTVSCAITVTDDFGQALGYVATDTFTLSIRGDSVRAVTFEGDDPPVFEAVFDWIGETRPEVFTGPCRDMFDGGTTPGDCARAVAEAARAYVDLTGPPR